MSRWGLRSRSLTPAARRGSQAHDEMERDPATGEIRRRTNRAGGVEGGVSNGEVLRVRKILGPHSLFGDQHP